MASNVGSNVIGPNPSLTGTTGGTNVDVPANNGSNVDPSATPQPSQIKQDPAG